MKHDPQVPNYPVAPDSDDLVITLGDAAEMTLGNGRAKNENKRHPYN